LRISKNNLYLLTWFLFGMLSSSINAQTDSSKNKVGLKAKLLDQVNNGNLGLIPVPVFGYGPETGFVFGLSFDYYFNTSKPDKDTTTRESFMYTGIAFSTRKQFFSELFWQIYGPSEKYVLRGKGGYSDFSEYYWGTGNTTLKEKNYLTITYNILQFKNRILFKTKAKNFIGLGVNYALTNDIETIEKEFLPNNIKGSRFSRVVGIGPALLYDYRNNPFSPNRGWYAEYYNHFHHPSMGSNFTFIEHHLDLRKYFKAFGTGMLGLQFLATLNNGNVPLRELPRLGGGQMLRGYILGRYRDKQLWAAQAETRLPIGKYLGVALFGAVGQVNSTLANFKNGPLHSSIGTGLRIKLNEKKQIYSRIDYAQSANGTGQLYLKLMDAF
jgi:outer membrane protein assembly factor BamA